MPNSADILSWASLTSAIDERKAPLNFLKNRFFPRDEPKETKNLELSFFRRGRKIAPFVKRGSAALQVDGHTEDFAIVRPPHIRIKRPMTPSELLDKRRPGSVIFAGKSGIEAAMRAHIAREQQNMLADLFNTEEYLAALALRGAVAYTSEDEESFEVTFPRSASHDIALSGGDLWSAPTTANPVELFQQVTDLVSDAVSMNVTTCIMSPQAADAFLKINAFEKLLDIRRFTTGTLDFTTQQNVQTGAQYMGTTTHGIQLWRYGKTLNVQGETVQLIRPGYVEFVAEGPMNEWVTYYGAIEDMKAIGAGKVLAAKRFSKSWEEEDPSARMLLMESNPLCVPRRPDASVSVDVLGL